MNLKLKILLAVTPVAGFITSLVMGSKFEAGLPNLLQNDSLSLTYHYISTVCLIIFLLTKIVL